MNTNALYNQSQRNVANYAACGNHDAAAASFVLAPQIGARAWMGSPLGDRTPTLRPQQCKSRLQVMPQHPLRHG